MEEGELNRMKLLIYSDLHLEFGAFQPPPTGADVVVLAGDIAVGVDGIAWAGSMFRDKPVIYVPGNHEFYGHDIELTATMKAQAPANVYVLDNEEVEIQGVHFLGCILWTDFRLFGESEKYFGMQYANHMMNDFNVILNNGRRFTAHQSAELHQYSRKWLSRTLAENHGDKTVVVTHHVPSPRSCHPRFQNDRLSPAFVSDLEDLMDGDRAELWVHGHTHDSFGYVVNGTRVLCNPRGYSPFALNPAFNPLLVVEV